MKILEKSIDILKDDFVCNKCLGRQFAQLLSGSTNEERGRIIRNSLAMAIDSGEKICVDTSNFYEIKFHNVKVEIKKPKKCSVCGEVFPELKKKVKLILKELKKHEFNTFLVGCKLTQEFINREQELWERVGIHWCESIKSEINRELGKEIEKTTGKKMKRRNPDITILIDLERDEVEVEVRSIYVFGKYQKLVRGIPQTKWKKKIYKTSVQEMIEKPFLKQTKAEKSSFHGEGREDINVRCLGWRPFVLELINPKKRKIGLKESKTIVNESKKVKVKDLKIVEKNVIRRIKSAMHDKTYKATVEFENPLENPERIKELKESIISQKTPTRVLRRRAKKVRRRMVKNIKYKVLDKNRVELEITTQGGLYVKELINGDKGRTQPNVSDMIGNKVKKIELDVIKIWD